MRADVSLNSSGKAAHPFHLRLPGDSDIILPASVKKRIAGVLTNKDLEQSTSRKAVLSLAWCGNYRD